MDNFSRSVVNKIGQLDKLTSGLKSGSQGISLADTVTVTVGAGKDFSTIQSALNFFEYKACKNCRINIDPGTYTESITIPDYIALDQNAVSLVGDTRQFVGISYCHNTPGNPIGYSNLGTQNGNVTISNSGSNLTIAVSGGNPNFATAGLVNGDKLLVVDSAGTTTEVTVSSVATNVITLTTTAPTMSANGCSVTFCPNRIITQSGSTSIFPSVSSNIGISGIYCKQTGTGSVIASTVVGTIIFFGGCVFAISGNVNNVLISGSSLSIYGTYTGSYNTYIQLGTASGSGLISFYAQQVYTRFAYAIKFSNGFAADRGTTFFDATTCTATRCSTGFASGLNSQMNATSCATNTCTTGFFAANRGAMYAASTNALAINDGAKFSPVTSDAFGNSNGSITWS